MSKVISISSFNVTPWLKSLRSKAKTVSHAHVLRGMGRPHLFTSSRDWFQWLLWLWFDKTQLKTTKIEYNMFKQLNTNDLFLERPCNFMDAKPYFKI